MIWWYFKMVLSIWYRRPTPRICGIASQRLTDSHFDYPGTNLYLFIRFLHLFPRATRGKKFEFLNGPDGEETRETFDFALRRSHRSEFLHLLEKNRLLKWDFVIPSAGRAFLDLPSRRRLTISQRKWCQTTIRLSESSCKHRQKLKTRSKIQYEHSIEKGMGISQIW